MLLWNEIRNVLSKCYQDNVIILRIKQSVSQPIQYEAGK